MCKRETCKETLFDPTLASWQHYFSRKNQMRNTMKLQMQTYKGFTITKRSKSFVSSAYDYDWFDGKLWHYAPNWDAAKTDIDLFLISSVFDTTGI